MTRPGHSLWLDRPASGDFAPLAGDVDCDVLVIGAGITGTCTTWELATSGVDVVLLDATRLAGGTTGASTAKVTALQGTAYSRLVRLAGTESARAYADVQALAVEHLATIAERVGGEASVDRCRSWLFAETDAGAEALAAERDAAEACGLRLDRDLDPRLPFPVTGSLSLADQLVIHPVSLCAAIASDAARHGARIFEDTPVVELDTGDPHQALTRDGHTVRARQVVVATHFPCFEQGLLFARLRVRREHVLLGRAEVTPPDMYVSAEDDVRSVRRVATADGDLLLVSGAPFAPGGEPAEERRADLEAWAHTHFAGFEPHRAWSAQDCTSPDGLPFVGELRPFTHHGDGVWGATGFGGWGLANGVAAGVLLRDLVLGADPHGWRELFTTARGRPRSEVPRVVAQGFRHVRGAGARLAVPRLELGEARETLARLPRGDAVRLAVDGETLAVHRDREGRLHAVSATCTHMGCLVDFDAASDEWACPCHGSRFALDGSVVEGPAVDRLRAVDLGPEADPGVETTSSGTGVVPHPRRGDITMPGSKHGPSVKDPELYEELREDGASKEKAARIANEAASSSRSEVGRKGGKSGDYEDWTVDDLRKRAAEVGIEGRSSMDKSELIDALRHH